MKTFRVKFYDQQGKVIAEHKITPDVNLMYRGESGIVREVARKHGIRFYSSHDIEEIKS